MFADLQATDEQLDQDTGVSAAEQKHTCTKCGGTGMYQGIRVHQEKSQCFACKGKGYFKTSAFDRQKAKAKRDQKKADKQAEKTAAAVAYMEEHSELFEFMKANNHWNNFFASMIDAVAQYGRLTDNQVAAAYRSMDKIKAKQSQKEAEKPVLDLTKLNEVFANASENGLKKPKLRIADLVISLAPDHGRNAGYLYVKYQGNYAGKISPEGVFTKTFNTPEEVEQELIEFCKAPMEAAVKYGRETGNCACCGRTLTDPKSIELGIGPICLEKWF